MQALFLPQKRRGWPFSSGDDRVLAQMKQMLRIPGKTWHCCLTSELRLGDAQPHYGIASWRCVWQRHAVDHSSPRPMSRSPSPSALEHPAMQSAELPTEWPCRAGTSTPGPAVSAVAHVRGQRVRVNEKRSVTVPRAHQTLLGRTSRTTPGPTESTDGGYPMQSVNT